jgi:hypothetical protein
MSEENLPASPLSELAQAATQLHELFSAYRAAGFTDQQALYLTACAACGGPKEQR